MKKARPYRSAILIAAVLALTISANAAQQQSNVIAHFHLCGTLTETPMEDPFGLMGGQMTSLKSLLARMELAAKDDQVKAVVLTFDNMAMGFGQIEEIRGSMKKIKAADKKIYIHAEGMSTLLYALLSGGSHLSVAPESSLWINGIYTESVYAKTLLEKIGVEADFLHMGDYKSAAETMTRTAPSEQAAENMNWLLDGLYGATVKMISESRGIDDANVSKLIDAGPYMADEALKAGMIDSVKTRDEFIAQIKKDFGQDVTVKNNYGSTKGPQVNFSNPFAFFSMFSGMADRYKTGKNSVGIVYVEGMIVSGHKEPSPFGEVKAAFSGDIRKALETAANDDSVKAVVLRVDSPGGSAEASEVILNAVNMVKEKKPVIVSMGNVAASGGYYISCQADAIFADESTITASIGVVGGKFITTSMWNKLGINWVGYKRGANADIFTSARHFDDVQRDKIENYMNKVYSVFKGHVTKGRGSKLTKPIEEIAGGRVYTGKQALELKLVDEIGSLSDAIKYAAEKASLSDYEVRVIPRSKDFITAMMEKMSGQGESPTDITVGLGKGLTDFDWPMLRQSLAILQRLDPQRTKAVRNMIAKIELIGKEGAVLMMPQELIIY